MTAVIPPVSQPASAPHYLVTGGAGFIGSHLVERLLRDGCQVTVVDDFSTGHAGNLATVAHHPLVAIHSTRVSAWPHLEQTVARTSAIFHLAATVGVDLVLRRTAGAIENIFRETAAVLRAAAQHRVPVILASSSEVYGRSRQERLREDDELVLGPPPVGRWSYGGAKLLGEYLALALASEQQLPVTVARIFNTVGRRQSGSYGMVLPRFIHAVQHAQPLTVFGDGRQTRCFCAVEDTVEALVRLQRTEPARGQIVNVGNDAPIEIRALAGLVRQRYEAVHSQPARSALEFIPYLEAYGAGARFEELPRRRPCLERLERLTGFRATRPLADTIDAMLRDTAPGELSPRPTAGPRPNP